MAIVYRGSPEAATALEQEIKQKGGTALALQCDVADAAAVKPASSGSARSWGRWISW